MTAPLVVSEEVAYAIAKGLPVVAMESTIFSTLGLPQPSNREAFDRCTSALRTGGAVPALTAVLDGAWHVGIEESDEERVLAGTRKVAERDLAVAAAQRWPVGVTTVSASVALADRARVEVFATGGIGGVHRRAADTGDISADLDALASHPVVTVCAGAKAFLDLALTLEYLETAGVPVLGWHHDWFPAFYVRSSGLPIPHRVDSAVEVAEVLRYRIRESTGVLVTVPIPVEEELDEADLSACIETALADCEVQGVTGSAVTPYVLSLLSLTTGGRSLGANLALAERNAQVGAEIAVALARLRSAQ